MLETILLIGFRLPGDKSVILGYFDFRLPNFRKISSFRSAGGAETIGAEKFEGLGPAASPLVRCLPLHPPPPVALQRRRFFARKIYFVCQLMASSVVCVCCNMAIVGQLFRKLKNNPTFLDHAADSFITFEKGNQILIELF